jgi:hypothetical protein
VLRRSTLGFLNAALLLRYSQFSPLLRGVLVDPEKRVKTGVAPEVIMAEAYIAAIWYRKGEQVIWIAIFLR